MLVICLLVASATAVTAAAALLRRRRARQGELAPRHDALPAGRHLLASGVSDLSDLGLHLHLARRSAKARLGAVLVQR
jgi:hypothetical protein